MHQISSLTDAGSTVGSLVRRGELRGSSLLLAHPVLFFFIFTTTDFDAGYVQCGRSVGRRGKFSSFYIHNASKSNCPTRDVLFLGFHRPRFLAMVR